MNNGNLLIGLVLGFVLGNDTARNMMLGASDKMLKEAIKELNKNGGLNNGKSRAIEENTARENA